MAGPLGDDVRTLGAPTTDLEDIAWWAPWGTGMRPWSKGVL
jgi:hypothetical protein